MKEYRLGIRFSIVGFILMIIGYLIGLFKTNFELINDNHSIITVVGFIFMAVGVGVNLIKLISNNTDRN